MKMTILHFLITKFQTVIFCAKLWLTTSKNVRQKYIQNLFRKILKADLVVF